MNVRIVRGLHFLLLTIRLDRDNSQLAEDKVPAYQVCNFVTNDTCLAFPTAGAMKRYVPDVVDEQAECENLLLIRGLQNRKHVQEPGR